VSKIVGISIDRWNKQEDYKLTKELDMRIKDVTLKVDSLANLQRNQKIVQYKK